MSHGSALQRPARCVCGFSLTVPARYRDTIAAPREAGISMWNFAAASPSSAYRGYLGESRKGETPSLQPRMRETAFLLYRRETRYLRRSTFMALLTPKIVVVNSSLVSRHEERGPSDYVRPVPDARTCSCAATSLWQATSAAWLASHSATTAQCCQNDPRVA